MEEKKNVQHTHIDIYILLVVLALLGGLLYVFVSRKTTAPQSVKPQTTGTQETVPSTEQSRGTAPTIAKILPSPTPSPKPIPHGKTDFFVSVGNNVKGPRMGKGTVDPYDPSEGTNMSVTIEANDTTPVQKVTMTVKTDHKTSAELPLEAVAGTKNWKGSWTVDDSYLYTYQLTIKATSASGTSSVDVLLR